MQPRVDYDLIAERYDEPDRDHDVDPGLLEYVAQRDIERLRVLDVGCGTGKQLAADREPFADALLVGLDRFAGMLTVARGRCPAVTWLQGDGAVLPFADGSFDYATSQYSYQHVRRTETFFGEVHRVLRPGGRFVIRNAEPWSMDGWAIYRFFPESRELDHRDFAPTDRLCAVLRETGFVDVRSAIDHRPERIALDDVLAYCSDRHRTSQLFAIPDDAYQAGLERIRRLMREHGTIASELAFVTVWADVPASVCDA